MFQKKCRLIICRLRCHIVELFFLQYALHIVVDCNVLIYCFLNFTSLDLRIFCFFFAEKLRHKWFRLIFYRFLFLLFSVFPGKDNFYALLFAQNFLI